MMGLLSYNKRFLAACVDAPGSTHDSRLLRHTKAFMDIVDGKTLPNKAINLGEKYAEIPLVTIGDCAFPSHSWLLMPYPDTTRNEKEKLFNLKLRSARVTTKNCYGMLKSRFRIIYQTN